MITVVSSYDVITNEAGRYKATATKIMENTIPI